MVGIILYLILIVVLFILTWAGIGSISLNLKEVQKSTINQIDELKTKVEYLEDCLVKLSDNFSKTLNQVSENENSLVDCINNSLSSIYSEIENLKVEKHKEAKKRTKSKKKIETREDLENL